MLTKRKRRIFLITSILLSVSTAVGLTLYALRQSVDLYYTPKQVWNHHIPVGKRFRLGGMVVKDSIHRKANSLKVDFILTDYHRKIIVLYDGILPTLFREGQGIVAEGSLDKKGFFVASRVLAKHDANYRPPQVNKSMTHDS